ncbi:hypothetical protein PORY_001752 [Pneumocystis oryctolagi]|uniref:Uncharacterized protein n=1 Tax=Pneumocystis oryctolagi TaxID=42067 RepID=A0ACB7CHG8_9ASCO|nr:hypothetical protein PORY_001752 [Pneumocystis oryctolagi]
MIIFYLNKELFLKMFNGASCPTDEESLKKYIKKSRFEQQKALLIAFFVSFFKKIKRTPVALAIFKRKFLEN